MIWAESIGIASETRTGLVGVSPTLHAFLERKVRGEKSSLPARGDPFRTSLRATVKVGKK